MQTESEARSDARNTSLDATEEAAEEMSLREQLLAAAGQSQPRSPEPRSPQPIAPALPRPGSSDTQQHPDHIDPAISPTFILPQNRDVGTVLAESALQSVDEAESRSAKPRELSGTKRAAQNRAAQRAFRQRKEGYIKRLEDQVRGGGSFPPPPPPPQDVQKLEAANQRLRDYVAVLQTRLLEIEGSYPMPDPAPPARQLENKVARALEQDTPTTSSEPMGPGAISQLQAAAAAAQAERMEEDQARPRGDAGGFDRSGYPPMPPRQDELSNNGREQATSEARA
ncbi:MAG: hypothetical protein M1828_004340 [Chrysothrix sp. TS-e1954]|nr:MAG: hypothetical protein M1828_004340 [Chrysothrix sp. TS-e1954]